MTVAQLIDKLHGMPPNAKVVRYVELSGMFEAYSEIGVDDARLASLHRMEGHPQASWNGLYVDEGMVKGVGAGAVCKTVGPIEAVVL